MNGPRLCANGHVMDPSWAICPYCPKPKIPPTAVRPAAVMPSATLVRPVEKLTAMHGVEGQLFGWLVPLDGLHRWHSFELRRGRTMIGSDPSESQLVLADDGISKRHAEVFFLPEKREWCIEDLRSLNGTFLNDDPDRIETRRTLVDNDVIRLGKLPLIFKALPESAFSATSR